MTRPIKLLNLYPRLLNLNGDAGNIEVLAKRLGWYGQAVELENHNPNEILAAHDPDFILLGHGQEAAWRLIREDMRINHSTLLKWLTAGIPALAVGSGYEYLHSSATAGDDAAGLYPEVLARVPRRSSFASAQLGEHQLVGYVNSESDASLVRKDFALIGTLLHGPILAKNPHLADWFCDQLLKRVARERPIVDSVEKNFVDRMAVEATELALKQI